MAPRSSIYGSIASMVPEWAFGGDYGDISNMLNNRELSFENLQQQQIANDINAARLDAFQRRASLDDAVAEQFQGQRPTSMRDAYSKMLGTAFDMGDVDTALSIQSKLENIDKLERQQRISDLQDSARFANALGYERTKQLFPDSPLTPEDVAALRAGRGRGEVSSGGSGRAPKEKMVDAIDPSTGFVSQVPWSQALVAQQQGLLLDPSSAEKERIRQEVQAKIAQPPAQDGPGMLDGFFSWLDSKPGEKQEAQQKDIVDNIKGQASRYRTFRNKRTGEVVTLPEGQTPR